jgi:hypothetical protein
MSQEFNKNIMFDNITFMLKELERKSVNWNQKLASVPVIFQNK